VRAPISKEIATLKGYLQIHQVESVINQNNQMTFRIYGVYFRTSFAGDGLERGRVVTLILQTTRILRHWLSQGRTYLKNPTFNVVMGCLDQYFINF
jgi:hypothetical protein